MQRREKLEGVLLKVEGNAVMLKPVTSPDTRTNFRYTHSTSFNQSCQGKGHIFETESNPRGLCRVLSYQCNHQ